jgi:hypothetical protein
MTPSPDSFSVPDAPPDLPLPLDAADAPDTERVTLGVRLVASVGAFFSALADRSHMADSPAFFETDRLSTRCASFRRDAQ